MKPPCIRLFWLFQIQQNVITTYFSGSKAYGSSYGSLQQKLLGEHYEKFESVQKICLSQIDLLPKITRN